ncbi:MAG: glycosyltransferase family 4 protein [Ferruginibacter sp.]
MIKKRRIILAIPSLQAGGMERVMAELAGYFAGKEYMEVHLVLYGLKRDIFYQLPSNIIIHKPSFEFDNSGLRIKSIFKTISFLRNTISSVQPDAVLSFGEYWNSLVLLSLLWKKIPVFVSDRCQPDKKLGRLQEFLRKWLYPKAAGIVVQTAIAKKIYQENIGHKNIQVIGNPIRSIHTKTPVQKQNIVLTVGRLIKTKHHDELIKLFAGINMAGWKLIIVGDDVPKQNNLQRLKELVQQLGMTDKVILAGRQQNVEEYYTTSKIFAFTSSSEGFPNVVGEAQAAGLPVVTFDCPCGPSEMITDGKNGFLIPLFDYKTFREKLELLMNDELLREKFGADGKHSVRQFSVDITGATFENFILGEK